MAGDNFDPDEFAKALGEPARQSRRDLFIAAALSGAVAREANPSREACMVAVSWADMMMKVVGAAK